MNISKKAIMSFIVALTSVISMAQPYYHIMKDVNGKLTEDTVYNGKDYNIKIDMENRPKDAIGGKITVEYDCTKSKYKRSFYFTNKGNVYYDKSTGKFGFEESQLDYPSSSNKNHCGLFNWAKTLSSCISTGNMWLEWFATEEDFYFANPDSLPRLQKDLGNERWAVLSACEWDYVFDTCGEWGWTVDEKVCFLIDTTPGKSLLSELRRKNSGNPRNLSIDEFKSLEAQGLVCLPACGSRISWSFYRQGQIGNYWSCTPDNPYIVNMGTYRASFDSSSKRGVTTGYRSSCCAVRLVILADE